MHTAEDIFHKMAQDLKGYSGIDKTAALEEFIASDLFEFHLAITKDIEATALGFLNQFGQGHTYYFKLINIEHGKRLAHDIFWILYGEQAELTSNKHQFFSEDDKLFLFIYVKDRSPENICLEG